MTMAGLLLAAVLQAPSTQVRFECGIPPRPGRTDSVPMHLSIALALDGNRIASVLIDGPPVFSSYRMTRVRRDSPELGAADPNPRLLPRNMQWRGNFQGRAIRLRREGTEIVLEPAATTADYSGFWNHQLSAVPWVEVNGTISCHTVAGSLSESARS
jgi:hypothetical protein